jgi:hypothetical protein
MHRHLARIAELPDWSRKFTVPIPIQNRKPLSTLNDAANFINALPTAEQEAPAWWTASELVRMVAETGGDPMMARTAMMKALHRDQPRPSAQRRRRFSVIR